MNGVVNGLLRGAGAGVIALGVAACQPSAPPAERQPTLVEVETVQTTDYAKSQVLTGSVEARSETPQAFLIGGKLTELLVEVGDHVEEGQVLARLAPAEQQADVEAATAALEASQSQLDQAQATLDRQTSLFDQGLITRGAFEGSQTALETARNARDSAQAQLATAQQGLAYATLRASASGIITHRQFEPDEVVQAGAPVVMLAEDGPRDAVIEVQETAIAGRDRSLAVDVALLSDPSSVVGGRVREVSPVLDAQTGTITTKIELSDTPAGFSLGAPVTVTLAGQPQPRIVLPWSALWLQDGSPSVWIVGADDTVSVEPVTVDAYGTGVVVIADGLSEGQVVVTKGTKLLTPGQTVEPMESAS
ncbi:efflux RND transporter periplasmic adaptor subunit [Devosia sp. PTR5]|uniref:Efflux RND transporter periplasmic adaptor subunit n=1 Tax=Devosia oryzisoli TaxID=2774138 RepID=A0A927FYE5_9HYPH|nr:efflux RND transporter periplasmic adaptor subunit [Devosia oryzisoli]MBD8066939.1 efflux RND transporter periplasmic adaptor subunit [Devosia oryzisoli]